jgi:hypothetical protein
VQKAICLNLKDKPFGIVPPLPFGAHDATSVMRFLLAHRRKRSEVVFAFEGSYS